MIHFCLAASSRNRFLQAPTGLLGGDDWQLGTYRPRDAHLLGSKDYAQLVTEASAARGDTDDPLQPSTGAAADCQREPGACWYAIGTAVVLVAAPRPLGVSGGVLVRLQWGASESLWNTARVPGQCVTVVHQGSYYQGSTLASSTADVLDVALASAGSSGGVPPPPPLRAGETVRYMLRPAAPSTVLLGPVYPVAHNVVRVQADGPWSLPAPQQALLYLGARHAGHPVYTCALAEAQDARQQIYAVVSVSPAPGATALKAAPVACPSETWTQLTPHLAVGRLYPTSAGVLTGMEYRWPYPADQPGKVWLLSSSSSADATAPMPSQVWFVRAIVLVAAATAEWPPRTAWSPPLVLPLAGDASQPMVDGDRVLALRAVDAAASAGVRPATAPSDDGVALLQWDASAQGFDAIQRPSPQPSGSSSSILVVVPLAGCAVLLFSDGPTASWALDWLSAPLDGRDHPSSLAVVSLDATPSTADAPCLGSPPPPQKKEEKCLCWVMGGCPAHLGPRRRWWPGCCCSATPRVSTRPPPRPSSPTSTTPSPDPGPSPPAPPTARTASTRPASRMASSFPPMARNPVFFFLFFFFFCSCTLWLLSGFCDQRERRDATTVFTPTTPHKARKKV